MTTTGKGPMSPLQQLSINLQLDRILCQWYWRAGNTAKLSQAANRCKQWRKMLLPHIRAAEQQLGRKPRAF